MEEEEEEEGEEEGFGRAGQRGHGGRQPRGRGSPSRGRGLGRAASPDAPLRRGPHMRVRGMQGPLHAVRQGGLVWKAPRPLRVLQVRALDPQNRAPGIDCWEVARGCSALRVLRMRALHSITW
jgi:hypothetical protein